MNNPKILAQENSEVKAEVYNCFQRGDLKWNTGSTVEEKREGINLILQGLRTMKNIWIPREIDQLLRQTLLAQYQARYEDVGKKLNILEKYEKGEPKVEQTGGQKQQNKNLGENVKEKDQKSELSNALNDAIVKNKPNVKWTDIAGLEQAKAALQEAVLLPIKFPNLFQGARTPWKRILMYGPPGTGKTFLAIACAAEAEGTFFSVSTADLISKYVGGSEKLIKTLFFMARDYKPSIIFIDEIVSIFGAKGEGQNDDDGRRIITEFLAQMQGFGNDNEGVIVLGTTDKPWALDKRIIKIFEKRIYIPLPDVQARKYMIQNSLKKTKNTLTKEQFEDLAVKTEGYSGFDISVLVKDAVYEPVRKLQSAKKFRQVHVDGAQKWLPVGDKEDGTLMTFMQLSQNDIMVPDVSYNDFFLSLEKQKISVSQDQLGEFEKWTREFGQEG